MHQEKFTTVPDTSNSSLPLVRNMLGLMHPAGEEYVLPSNLLPLTYVCHSHASAAKRLCTNFIDPSTITPLRLLACRLIVLNKNPGVRPIGIGATARRIMPKAILMVTRMDIQEAAGSIQLCAGQISGIEASVHAVHSLFQRDETEAILLVDANNAFNSLNRLSALHNIRRLCPPLATVLINCYRVPTELFVDGDVLHSSEGTTQGDPCTQ